MSDYLGDVLSLATADGKVWHMPDGEHFVTAYGGFGMPATSFVTSTAFRQSFARERGVLFERRDISLTFHEVWSGDRARYWRKRSELIEMFRFNRGGPLVLTLRAAGGVKRALSVYGDPGPGLPAGDPADNLWKIEESLSLVAFDPIWRNPDPIIRTGVRSFDSGGFVFPITFPITFGRAGAQYVFDEPYPGTFDAYPSFVVTGPYQSATFTNDVNGASFTLGAALTASEQRVIALDPTARSIVDANGVNRFDDLGDGFDLVRFKLLAAPYAPGGQQIIRVSIIGSSPATAVQMSYYEAYLGI